jgi:hypothetical protein
MLFWVLQKVKKKSYKTNFHFYFFFLKNKIVPLKGFLDYGYIDSALSIEEEENGDQQNTKIIESGKIEGYVAIDNLPPHNQW